jgi:hypothetical protein
MTQAQAPSNEVMRPAAESAAFIENLPEFSIVMAFKEAEANVLFNLWLGRTAEPELL